MTYLATPRKFTPAEFSAHFDALDFATASWSPKMLVLHNTDQPSLAQWLIGGATPEQRLANLQGYYRRMHWHSGPHWFVAPDAIWEFCDPLQDGVHCSCANHVAFGCEMVGDYAAESFDHGPGAEVRDNAVHVIATVFKRFGWRPDPLVFWERGLAFHKHCERDHHDCPGKNVGRADVVARVLAAMEPHADDSAPSPAGEIPGPAAQVLDGPERVKWLQESLNGLGARPRLSVDGVMGRRTRTALAAWQVKTNLVATGSLSPVTAAALRHALGR